MKRDPLKDGISSVELLTHMGDDLTVVNAARVSMAKESNPEFKADPNCWRCFGEGVWKDSNKDFHDCHCVEQLPMGERDTKLIDYLAKHNHWTPFSHPQIQLRIKMPIFIARQWFKHMVGFTRNEVSRRYVDDTPECYIPTEWRKRAANVKQGSSEELADVGITAGYSIHEAMHEYRVLLAAGVCPEMARMVLPQSMYTEFVETGSLAAYARLCNLRLDPHAQKEVRLYAEAVYQIIKKLFPVSAKALVKEAA